VICRDRQTYELDKTKDLRREPEKETLHILLHRLNNMRRPREKLKFCYDSIIVFERGQVNSNDADAMTDGVVTGGRKVYMADIHD